jgi:hypothetical protein
MTRKISPIARLCELIELFQIAPRTRAEISAFFGVRTGDETIYRHIREMHQHGLIYIDATDLRPPSGRGPNSIRFAWQPSPFAHPDADGGEAMRRYRSRSARFGGVAPEPYVRPPPRAPKKPAAERKRLKPVLDKDLVPVQRVLPPDAWSRKPAGLAPAQWHEVIA